MRKLGITLAGLGTVFGSTAFAIGLGEIKVDSALGQPLSAEVPLLSLGKTTVSEIKAHLASKESFNRVGLDRPLYLDDLKFKIIEDKDGQPMVRISTKHAINRAYMSFLMNVKTPTGKLFREYTLFLDPPGYADELDADPFMRARAKKAAKKAATKKTAAVQTTRDVVASHQNTARKQTQHVKAAARKTVAHHATKPVKAAARKTVAHHATKPARAAAHKTVTHHATKPARAAAHKTVARHAAQPAKATSHKTVAHHTTKHVKVTPHKARHHHPKAKHPTTPFTRYGHTLPAVSSTEQVWRMARHISHSSKLPLAQVEVAILTNNSDAFRDDNINGLQVGKPLYIPTLSEIKEIPADVARREIQSENRAWRKHRATRWLPETLEVSLGKSAVTTTVTAQSEHEQALKAAAKRSEEAKAIAAKKAKEAQMRKQAAEAAKQAAEQQVEKSVQPNGTTNSLTPLSPAKPAPAPTTAPTPVKQSSTKTTPHFAVGKLVPVAPNMGSTQVTENDSTINALRTELYSSLNALDAAKHKNENLTSRVKTLTQQNQSLKQGGQGNNTAQPAANTQPIEQQTKPAVTARLKQTTADKPASAHKQLVALSRSTLDTPTVKSHHSGGASIGGMSEFGSMGYAGLLAMAGLGGGLLWWRRRRRYLNDEELFEADFDADEAAAAFSGEQASVAETETNTAEQSSAFDTEFASTEDETSDIFAESASSIPDADDAGFDEAGFDNDAGIRAREALRKASDNLDTELTDSAFPVDVDADEQAPSLHMKVSEAEFSAQSETTEPVTDDFAFSTETQATDDSEFFETAELPNDQPLEFPAEQPTEAPQDPSEQPVVPNEMPTETPSEDAFLEAMNADEPEDSSALDFVLTTDDDGEASAPESAVSESDLDALDRTFDTSSDEPEQSSDNAEDVSADRNVVATKLDLARVYVEMGDHDSARDMLQDVLSSGDQVQKTEAQQLLDGMSAD